VKDAEINFGASKISVYGETTVEDLEKAGAFENLSVRPEGEKQANQPKQPFFKRYWQEMLAILLIICGYTSAFTVGEDNFATTGFFIGAILVAGIPLFKAGLRNLLRLEFDMRTLMTIAIIGASIIGEWGEAAVVVVLFAISEALESYSMDKARSSIRSLMDIAPKTATIRRGAEEKAVDVEDIQIGDIMLVKPGEKIAMDGIVKGGRSSVNQAAITGESVPVEKTEDDEAFAGTLNTEGFLEIEVTKHVKDTTIAKIIHLVEEAQAERAPSQKFVDQFAKYYTPAIIGIAFLVAILPPLFADASWSTWVYQGLAVLVVGCPCALVISTPVSIVTAIGNAARNGVLVKGGVYLEQVAKIKAIAFDKTGTLTRGVPEVTDLELVSKENSSTTLAQVAGLEAKSQHPLASAILKKTEEEGISPAEVEAFQSLTGKGISGDIAGSTYYVGSIALFTDDLSIHVPQSILDRVESLQKQGKTVMVAGSSKEIDIILAVRDELREQSTNILANIHDLGVKETVMLTGDHYLTAKSLGEESGVKEVKAELLPQQKLEWIKHYEKNVGPVAMVGDGVNDAPALATSTVGVAMGGAGTDTALETADIALMADDLDKLPFTIRLSRKALRVIKQNISFSLIVKLLALLLVIPGWLTLWIAIFADMGATLLVTLNGLRLLRTK